MSFEDIEERDGEEVQMEEVKGNDGEVFELAQVSAPLSSPPIHVLNAPYPPPCRRLTFFPAQRSSPSPPVQLLPSTE